MWFNMQMRQDSGENSIYAATNRRFRSLYTTAKKGWSMKSFEDLIELQRANGLNMGDHYLDYHGAIKMLKFMYHDNHDTLIDLFLQDPLMIYFPLEFFSGWFRISL